MHQAASSIILPILLARPVICNAAICAQSIIPVIADSCGQSRTEPGLREKGKTHTQRAKLPKIRGTGTEPGNSIRTIADSQHPGTTPLHVHPAHTSPSPRTITPVPGTSSPGWSENMVGVGPSPATGRRGSAPVSGKE